MENHVDTSVQELTTEAMQDIDTMGQELTAAEERPIDNVTTDGQKAPTETQGPNRRRKQKSFTMDDGVHALLATQADAAGVSMSGYLETLILSAEDLSLDPRVIEILGAQATSIGMTKKALLEMLILRAEHVVSWDQQTADALGVLANRAGLSRQEFLECLLVRAEGVMTWPAAETEGQALVEVLGAAGVGGAGAGVSCRHGAPFETEIGRKRLRRRKYSFLLKVGGCRGTQVLQ